VKRRHDELYTVCTRRARARCCYMCNGSRSNIEHASVIASQAFGRSLPPLLVPARSFASSCLELHRAVDQTATPTISQHHDTPHRRLRHQLHENHHLNHPTEAPRSHHPPWRPATIAHCPVRSIHRTHIPLLTRTSSLLPRRPRLPSRIRPRSRQTRHLRRRRQRQIPRRAGLRKAVRHEAPRHAHHALQDLHGRHPRLSRLRRAQRRCKDSGG